MNLAIGADAERLAQGARIAHAELLFDPAAQRPTALAYRDRDGNLSTFRFGTFDLLDDDKRAVFVLYELVEWTMPEVAAAVGCPLQTAYTRFRAARKTLEEAMQRALGPRSDP